jgi:aspartate/methionine/tyrosine aminotransferase
MVYMRRNIVHPSVRRLAYPIREIVLTAHKMRDLGVHITWENIGDPIHKGERVEPWIKEIMLQTAAEDRSWAYCDTSGVLATREFLAERHNALGGVKITPHDILFFNGLGDSMGKLYSLLPRETRVIGPTPCYAAHCSAEAAHCDDRHPTFELDPHNGWTPDLDDLRQKVKYNDSIAGILLINPDNPTSAVHGPEVIEGIVKIAREFDLFLIFDEIYTNIVYGGVKTKRLAEVIGPDVCGLSMRGISKEYPWPGSRCGWIEILNRGRDKMFDAYVGALLAAKRLEVCSTTLPQMTIPRVMGDSRYPAHLERRAAMFEARAKEACAALSGIPGVTVNCPGGAFYLTVMFEKGVLTNRQSLRVENAPARALAEELVKGAANDSRFVYYLLAATGICVVPLSGFCCAHDGFRITLLECDDAKRAWTLKTLADAMREYLAA